MTSFRSESGGLIDRARPLDFTFDGKPYQGFAGDTLASALMANGVSILGRSFKYHRPRGVWGAWVDEPNAIMTVSLQGRELPNCLATTTMLENGMDARAVNAWPTARFDLKGGLDLFHRWLAAGFYYKTFIWPDWHFFEPSIRRMAGLGALSLEGPEDYVSHQRYDACDTLVVSGGAAGIAAARAAAEAGQAVVLVDDHNSLGGGLYQRAEVEGKTPQAWLAEQADAIRAAGGRVLTGTTAFGVFDHGLVGLVQNGPFGSAPRLIRMRTGRIVLASGALDRAITFANNDKPGVMSLMGALELLARYGVVAGERLAVLANHSLADDWAQALSGAGATVTRHDPLAGPVRALGWKTITGLSVDGVKTSVDGILCSGGLTPLVHLWRHAGGGLDWCEQRQAFLPGAAPKGMVAIGAANGTFDLAQALEEARATGPGQGAARPSIRFDLTPLWPKPGSRGRQWIDFQHDVTLSDVALAARENYVSVEHLKRYTTLGMASDQGKTSNMAGLAAMAAIQGRPIPEVGTTTFRPPFVPIPIAAYHGHHAKTLNHPVKRLALEPAHRAADAALCEYGGWLRPGWYGSSAPEPLIQAEARMARDAAGIFDGSPLGKIEVLGPDAEAFVNFMYYTTMATLKPGHIRYGFMLTEGGIVFDDGVVSRIDRNRFIISCSSSHVDSVRTHLETWRQDGHDPTRLFIHDMTHASATVTVTGPKARQIVDGLDLGVDLAPDAFPHMTLRFGTFRDAPARIARVSFTGDLSYEISVRPRQAPALWSAVRRLGEPLGAGPIGVEAVSILRAEKGYIMIGKDTDGETMPHDLGFGAARLRKKAAFVGDRSLHSAKANAGDRKSLVGLRVPADAPALPTGAHAIDGGDKPVSRGYVTSSYHSPNLGHPVALAIIENGLNRMGETVDIWHNAERRRAVICSPCFFDKDGDRLHA
ncbi:MAG: 2Fe-2S iron-sulfur cluster-binding protein [Pseudomonadota bacterium]